MLAGVTAAVLTIAAMVFDVKDIEGDRAAGVRTIPNQYGVSRTRRLAVGGALAVSICVLGAVAIGVVPGVSLALLAFTGYVTTYSLFATRDRSPLFYGFVVDGEHLLLALVALAVTRRRAFVPSVRGGAQPSCESREHAVGGRFATWPIERVRGCLS